MGGLVMQAPRGVQLTSKYAHATRSQAAREHGAGVGKQKRLHLTAALGERRTRSTAEDSHRARRRGLQPLVSCLRVQACVAERLLNPAVLHVSRHGLDRRGGGLCHHLHRHASNAGARERRTQHLTHGCHLACWWWWARERGVAEPRH
eukprot:scaffold117184_cov63-Phaeocystis_antarctica.AAC.3